MGAYQSAVIRITFTRVGAPHGSFCIGVSEMAIELKGETITKSACPRNESQHINVI